MNRFYRVGLILVSMTMPVLGQSPPPPTSIPSIPSRVAVVSTADTADLAALVMTELSSNAEINLVERDDLAKVGDELKLQQLASSDAVALGKLIGADGLIFITKGADGPEVRFTAVGLGYALFDDQAAPDEDPVQLAKSSAHRVAGYAPKLKLKPDQAVPISILNLRADYATPDSIALERKLTLLLESRLMSLPEYVVLERRHAWSLGFEHSISTTPLPLLHGAYVIDGSLSVPAHGAGDLTIYLRLRSPNNQQTPLEIHGPKDDLQSLVEQMTAALQKATGATANLPPWQPQTEAREYLKEGIWARRNHEPKTALEALDSAELLGETAPDLLAVRIPILCEFGGDVQNLDTSSSEVNWMDRHWQVPNSRLPRDPRPDERTDQMLRAIDDMNRYKKENGESRLGILKYLVVPNGLITTSDGKTNELENRVLYASSKVLSMLDQLHHPRADELRQAVRSLAGFDPLHQHLPDGGVYAFEYADEWAQSPEEVLAYYHALCAIMPVLYSPHGDALHQFLFRSGPTGFCSRFAKTPQKQNALFQQFVDQLIADPVTKPLGLWVRVSWPDPAEKQVAYHAFLDGLWSDRENLLQAHRLAFYLNQAGPLQSAFSKPADPEFISLMHYDLQHENEARPEGVAWWPDLFPPEEATSFWKELQGCKKRLLVSMGNNSEFVKAEESKYFSKLEDDYIKQFGNPGIPSASVPPASLEVNRFWNSYQASGTLKMAIRQIYEARGDDGTLWVYGYDDAPLQNYSKGIETATRAALFKISLPDLTTESSLFPEPICPQKLRPTIQMQVGSDAAYLVSRTDDSPPARTYLDRYHFSSRTWQRREIATGISELYLLGAKIYFNIVGESGLCRYDWESDQITLLASSRRRPAQNQFDDRSVGYSISDVFLAPDGKVCAQIDMANYVIQDTPGNWPPGPKFEMFPGIPKDQKAGIFHGLFWRNSTSEPMFQPLSKEDAWYRRSQEQIRSKGDILGYGFRGDEIFMLGRTETYTLWWLKPDRTDPIPIPLCLKIDDATQVLLKSLYQPAVLDVMEAPMISKHAPLDMIVTDQGLCLFSTLGGFWFLPFNDIDAYLKSVQK